MDLRLETPGVHDLERLVHTLATWQHAEAPMQLHPGDLGWHWREGAAALAAALRVWTRGDQIVALGTGDGQDLLRMTLAPEVSTDERVAEQVVADLDDPDRGVLSGGAVAVEVPDGYLVKELLLDIGWSKGEAWSPLGRDLAEPVEAPTLRVEVVDAARVADYTAVHRSAFSSPKLTDQRWQTMADGAPFANARSLVGYDENDEAVAEVTVWSAGPGRPGLLEPMGVHADHRHRGHGRQICLAAASALQDLGASQALVCTPSANTGGVATYLAAGYDAWPERLDRARGPRT